MTDSNQTNTPAAEPQISMPGELLRDTFISITNQTKDHIINIINVTAVAYHERNYPATSGALVSLAETIKNEFSTEEMAKTAYDAFVEIAKQLGETKQNADL